MNEFLIVGTLIAMVPLMPMLLKVVSRRLNRRLARKLAGGPVGALMRYDYDYAMALSRDVLTGELNAEQAARIADRCLRRVAGNPQGRDLREMILHAGRSGGASYDQD
jgi:hypothetical protein